MVAQRKSPIKVTAVVGEDRRLVIDLPSDAPTGRVTVVVTTNEEPVNLLSPQGHIERERVRTKLMTANALSTANEVEVVTLLNDDEWLKAGLMPPGTSSSEETLRELRGDE